MRQPLMTVLAVPLLPREGHRRQAGRRGPQRRRPAAESLARRASGRLTKQKRRRGRRRGAGRHQSGDARKLLLPSILAMRSELLDVGKARFGGEVDDGRVVPQRLEAIVISRVSGWNTCTTKLP